MVEVLPDIAIICLLAGALLAVTGLAWTIRAGVTVRLGETVQNEFTAPHVPPGISLRRGDHSAAGPLIRTPAPL